MQTRLVSRGIAKSFAKSCLGHGCLLWGSNAIEGELLLDADVLIVNSVEITLARARISSNQSAIFVLGRMAPNREPRCRMM